MKCFIAAILVILVLNASKAQTKLGVKLTSSIITQRIANSGDTIGIGKGSNAFVPSVTLFADLPLSKNYYFSTGLGYISKRINLVTELPDENTHHSKSYNIQYVRLPATIKLYTNEVALDKKLYFQFGPIFDIAVHNKEKNTGISIVEEFNPLDVALLFGAGLEIQLAPHTAIQLGISYSRGLINVVRSDDLTEDLIIKNDLYGIDIGIKF